jgi:hypothetical protein
MIQLCSSYRAGDFASKALGGVLDKVWSEASTLSGCKQATARGDAEAGKWPDGSDLTDYLALAASRSGAQTCEPSAPKEMLEMTLLLPLGFRVNSPNEPHVALPIQLLYHLFTLEPNDEKGDDALVLCPRLLTMCGSLMKHHEVSDCFKA